MALVEDFQGHGSTYVTVGQFVPEIYIKSRETEIRISSRDDLIECRYILPCPDLPGIFLVILKIFFSQNPVFITYKPICLDIFRVKFHLDLYIFGYCIELTVVINKHLSQLFQVVYIFVIAISIIGYLFQGRIV